MVVNNLKQSVEIIGKVRVVVDIFVSYPCVNEYNLYK